MTPTTYEIPRGQDQALPPIFVAGAIGYPVIVRFAPGCDHGAQLTISPPGLLRIAAVARAHDGLPVAVRLTAGAQLGTALLTVERDDRVVGSVTVVVEPTSSPTPG
jgi:hypothetical protein